MPLDPSQFEVIDDKPAQASTDQFEVIGDAKPASATPALDTSKLGLDPYDKYRLAIAHGATPENYSEIYGFTPGPLNPDWDAVRDAGYGGPILTTAGQVADAVGKGIVHVADIPTILRNKAKGAEDFNNPFHKETLAEREETQGSLFKLPRVDTKDLTGAAGAIGGVENRIASTAEDILGRPSSVFTLPLLAGEGALAQVAARVYGLNAAAQLPEEVKHAVDVYNDPNSSTADKADAIANPVVHGALSYMMLKHAGGKGPAPEVQGPYALGQVMQTPRGAVPDLKVEDFEPLDAQSGSPLSPQELIARQSRAPVLPETPEPAIKTFNLDEAEGGQNAAQERLQPKGNQPKHTGDASERPPAQPSGGGGTPPSTPPPAEAPQANEPGALPGDARGTPDKEVSQVSDAEAVSKMTPNEFAKALSDSGKQATHAGYELAQQIKTPEDRAQIKKYEDAANDDTKSLLKKLENAKTPTEQSQAFLEIQNANVKKQFFNEAGRLYDALEEVKKTGDTAAAAKKFGVDESFVKEPSREFVGMGGATPSEFEPGAGEGRDVYGISHEVREARAKAGVVEPAPRGQGISAEDSVERGQALLNGGVDPEAALNNFESTGRLKADDIAVTRARGEELARNARAAERQFGTESPEYKAAYDKISDWDRRTKKMQTEWHKQGMAQQGATDIDTGSFTGLQREFESQTGKKFTPKQEKTAKDKAQKVTEAADKTEEARQELFNELDRQSGDPKTVTAAERRALDAANKTVRDWATRRAQADAKARVAKTEAETKAAAAEQAKTQKVLDIATKKAREAAVRLAKAENDARVAEAAKKADDTQAKATQRALDAAMEVRKKAAADLAKAENDARVAQAANAKKVARVEVQRTKRALDAANKAVRDAAANAAKNARKDLGLSLSERAWQKARTYIHSGITNFDDIRNKLATDLGMSVDKVTKALAKTKRAKTLTDDLWKKQQDYRRLDQQAKRWVTEQSMPLIQKAIRAVPNLAFAAKVFGHGTVALGTHAPMVAFQPRFWKAYANDFIKMYKMVVSPAFYERQVQDLLRRPNYITARRAGLVNDPHQYEDYNSPEVTKWMGPVANMGNRGYSVLKILRQDMFDQYWNKLPKTAQIPEVAKAIADGVNHATGVVKMKAPPGSNIALFAPRLAASRAAWLVGDPLRALKTFTDWGNASEADKHFAINQVKEKAWVVGTMLGLLAANEGMLEATGSKQRVNFNDPMKRDWMKFKVGGLDVGYGNAMLSMARLPARLYKIRESDGGKLKNLVYPDEDTYSVLGEYGRSQLSPFASLAATLWFKSDWQNRPLPNSNRPMPKRLAARGEKPYTWTEFWSEQVLPIPAEEAAREVWKNGLGMSEPQIQQAKKALATISVMAATGARVEDDTDVSP